MTPTISIIIPVYKVERYLASCVDSVLAQSFRDIEVLLVDDGSPDGCPALCDAYARRDRRVRVVHKPNGGLSDARNAGLDAARGAFIGFVDADDRVDPDLYRRLYHALCGAGADVAVCAFCYTNERDGFGGVAGPVRGRVLGRDDAVRLLLADGELQNYVWNKLYRASLWERVRFPRGKAFEDIDTTWRLFRQARRVVLLPWPGYLYRIRGGSIVQSRVLQNEIDCANAGLDRYDALAALYPECAEGMAFGALHAVVSVWGLAWEKRAELGAAQRGDLRRFAAFAKPRARAFAASQRLGPTGRLTMRLLPHANALSFLAAHELARFYARAHPPQARQQAVERPFPRVSVIPARPEDGGAVCRALAAQDAPDWELLLADDGASSARLSRRDGRVRVLPAGPDGAASSAAEAAMGTYLLFADEAALDWPERLSAALEVAGAGGRDVVPLRVDAPETPDAARPEALRRALAVGGPLPADAVNALFRRAALEAADALCPAPRARPGGTP